MKASMPETPAKRDNAPIMMLVLAGVAALAMLAGYFLKPHQSGAVTSTQPITQRQIAKGLAANGIQK